ncbi:hypothetical protein ACPOLB_15135 [Rubrivivax sp. RP6-9]|uniref:hypothetical protein n=1 Tax=Rubrivivax sp. RP6-9 TaxID=3415750 RepID=UPI003CC57855
MRTVQTTAPEALSSPSALPMPPGGGLLGRLHDALGDRLRAPGAPAHGPSQAAFEQALQRSGRAGRGGADVPGDGETPLPEAGTAPAPLQPAAPPVARAPAGQVAAPDGVSTLLQRQAPPAATADPAAAAHWQLQLPPLQPGPGTAPQVHLQRLPDGHLHLVLHGAADLQRPGPLAALRDRLAARGHGLDSLAAPPTAARERDDHPAEDAP